MFEWHKFQPNFQYLKLRLVPTTWVPSTSRASLIQRCTWGYLPNPDVIPVGMWNVGRIGLFVPTFSILFQFLARPENYLCVRPIFDWNTLPNLVPPYAIGSSKVRACKCICQCDKQHDIKRIHSSSWNWQCSNLNGKIKKGRAGVGRCRLPGYYITPATCAVGNCFNIPQGHRQFILITDTGWQQSTSKVGLYTYLC